MKPRLQHSGSGSDAMRQQIDRLKAMVKKLIADREQTPASGIAPAPAPQNLGTRGAVDMPAMYFLRAKKPSAGAVTAFGDNPAVDAGGDDCHAVLHEVTLLLFSSWTISFNLSLQLPSHQYLAWQRSKLTDTRSMNSGGRGRASRMSNVTPTYIPTLHALSMERARKTGDSFWGSDPSATTITLHFYPIRTPSMRDRTWYGSSPNIPFEKKYKTNTIKVLGTSSLQKRLTKALV